MNISQVEFENYRNLVSGKIVPDENVNVIHGENGQGKTNLLEAIWLFTGVRSFRGAKDNETVNFNKESASLKIKFNTQEREQTAEINIVDSKRKAILNGIPQKSATCLMGNFCSVVFSPVHLSLIKDGPAERRKFIDSSICQMKPAFAKLILKYNHTLSQRNALLKDICYHSELLDMLEIWEDKLSIYGAEIVAYRLDYIEKIKKYASQIYKGISRDKEIFELEYLSETFKKDCKDVKIILEDLRKALFESRKTDIKTGFTSVGPHRDDIDIKLNQKSARSFGSQGQQRSCALSLKLAEAEVIKETINQKPIILLDDVMSELDSFRQDYVLNSIEGWQVFITCCDPSTLLKLTKGKAIKVKAGNIFD